MGQDVSCPCHTDTKNVYFSDDEDNASADVTAIKMPGSPTSTAMNTASSAHSSNPFDSSNSNSSSRGPPVVKGKSKKWSALPKDGSDVNTLPGQSTQIPGEDAIEEDTHSSPDDMESALSNVKGKIAFPGGKFPASSDHKSPTPPAETPPAEDDAAKAARLKQEAQNDRIVNTFNSVMLADGLKVLKHHRRSSKKAASRVIRFVPDCGGALVWDKPLRQPGAKGSRIPLDAINQVELDQRIVWISAGDERVGFETSKSEDADLMYQAICILVDRCHA